MSQRIRTSICVTSLACAATVVAAGSAAPSAAQEFAVVARSGDAAPGIGGGVTIGEQGFLRGGFNEFGHVFFGTNLGGSGIDANNDTATWLYNGQGPLRAVSREGPVVPAGAISAAMPFRVFLNDRGQLAFAAIDGNGPKGIFSGRRGQLELIAADGAAVSGLSNVNFATPSALGLNNNGGVLFTSALTGSGASNLNNQALFNSATPGTPLLLARENSPIPGAQFDGTNLLYGAAFLGIVSPAGPAVVHTNTRLEGTGDVEFGGHQALLPTVPGSLQSLRFSGDDAEDEFVFGGSFAPLSISDSGERFVFRSDLHSDFPNGSGSFDSLWLGHGNDASEIVRERETAPGTGGKRFFGSGSTFNGATNDDGDVYFTAPFGTANDLPPDGLGLWTMPGGGPVSKVLITGDPAPGLPGGTLAVEPGAAMLSMNDAGRVALVARVDGPAFGDNSLLQLFEGEALWLTDAAGQLRLIAARSQQIDLGNGDVRTILGVMAGAPRTFLNDAGQVLYRLRFTDGSSALLVSDPFLAADANGDDQISVADVGIVATNFGLATPDGRLDGDFNGDGTVSVADVGILATFFGQPNAAAAGAASFADALAAFPELANVPEPASFAATGVGAALITLGRRRHGRADRRCGDGASGR